MIGSVGTTANTFLLSMLSRLSGTSATSAASSPASSAAPSGGDGMPDNALKGSSKASISDQILALLVQMQNGTSSPSSSASTSSSSLSTSVSPLSQLMSTLDTDGDGTISQSELETYIEGQGGTQQQADALFAGLNQGGSGNLTQAQLSSDLQGARPAGAHGHHHGHHSASSVASQLVQAMDTDGDGSVSQSEFQSFVTGLGGTTGQANADFAALDPDNTGAVTTSQFSSAISAFEQAGQGQTGASPVLTLLDDIAGNPAQAG